MLKKRAIMLVAVDCDPVPGAFHTAESHAERLEARLQEMYPWYNPTVVLESTVTVKR